MNDVSNKTTNGDDKINTLELNKKARSIIYDLGKEGLELKQIKDCFNDGVFLAENGYNDYDQELVEEIDYILTGMIK